MSDTVYNEKFYQDQMDESRRSASRVIPVLFDYYKPGSVVDVGCGTGSWLAEFKARGIDDILGMDGNYVKREMLQIPQVKFVPTNLSESFRNLTSQKFDLAMSLEVAEHIPQDGAAEFVTSLVSFSDVILFSAAIPYQGGTNHHNENWQEFWYVLFRGHGYLPVDCIRPRVWNDPAVCWWYKQNAMLYVRESRIGQLLPGYKPADTPPPSIVHPEMFLYGCVRGRQGEAERFGRDAAYYKALAEAASRGELPAEDRNVIYDNVFNVLFDAGAQAKDASGSGDEIATLRSHIERYEATVAGKDSYIEELHKRMASLEAEIADFKGSMTYKLRRIFRGG